MRFSETAIAGVMVVDIEPRQDARGAFARLHCPDEFAAAGHPFVPVQTSLSRNPHPGTLRGMHYQPGPHAETKLVRAVRGRMFDVALDLRAASPTYRQWTSAELSAENGRALLIPQGVAHGFLTLEADTDVLYQISPAFQPGHEAGVRWDDPAFAITWPTAPALISPRDATYPDHRA
ncbi:dTDP-4-dehydrorhamnose 3,5-epimerase family protein [Phenylobacterium sp.]|jgi:dTDP-4-dehydrorhamnose 3,5-epimerase|uniref:dTDP-4-dehydrorhamnose 3,5-epimerase family protein n=1 Tax=Phenylobacterium sp. TaxID=1871053 RepID=UPI002E309173|nr:dTDP-4-dehydrorhamnose 3,5-epimerase family protein [Phenylobacterium sp.]HEX4709758.1 dTDP-4-dehydrorhamnose 3,5-epimerase family protein [Phenylobacterium sp.]